jgi:hypothetical protein
MQSRGSKRAQRPADPRHGVVPSALLEERVSEINAMDRPVLKIAPPVQDLVVVASGHREEIPRYAIVGQTRTLLRERSS